MLIKQPDYTGETLMPYGKYKLYKLKDVPAEYLVTIWDNNKGGPNPLLRTYLESNIEVIRTQVGQPKPLPPPVLLKCEKKAYINKRDAREALKRIEQQKGEGKKPMRSYECTRCSYWHLTSRSVSEYKKKKAMRTHKKR